MGFFLPGARALLVKHLSSPTKIKLVTAAAGVGGISAASMATGAKADDLSKVDDPKKAPNIYAFRAHDIDGKLVDLQV